MSLRRRIAAAAAAAVAAVAAAVALTGYLTTRSHLVGEVRTELRARAAAFLQPHPGNRQDEAGGPGQAQPRGGAQRTRSSSRRPPRSAERRGSCRWSAR